MACNDEGEGSGGPSHSRDVKCTPIECQDRVFDETQEGGVQKLGVKGPFQHIVHRRATHCTIGQTKAILNAPDSNIYNCGQVELATRSEPRDLGYVKRDMR